MSIIHKQNPQPMPEITVSRKYSKKVSKPIRKSQGFIPAVELLEKRELLASSIMGGFPSSTMAPLQSVVGSISPFGGIAVPVSPVITFGSAPVSQSVPGGSIFQGTVSQIKLSANPSTPLISHTSAIGQTYQTFTIDGSRAIGSPSPTYISNTATSSLVGGNSVSSLPKPAPVTAASSLGTTAAANAARNSVGTTTQVAAVPSPSSTAPSSASRTISINTTVPQTTPARTTPSPVMPAPAPAPTSTVNPNNPFLQTIAPNVFQSMEMARLNIVPDPTFRKLTEVIAQSTPKPSTMMPAMPSAVAIGMSPVTLSAPTFIYQGLSPSGPGTSQADLDRWYAQDYVNRLTNPSNSQQTQEILHAYGQIGAQLSPTFKTAIEQTARGLAPATSVASSSPQATPSVKANVPTPTSVVPISKVPAVMGPQTLEARRTMLATEVAFQQKMASVHNNPIDVAAQGFGDTLINTTGAFVSLLPNPDKVVPGLQAEAKKAVANPMNTATKFATDVIGRSVDTAHGLGQLASLTLQGGKNMITHPIVSAEAVVHLFGKSGEAINYAGQNTKEVNAKVNQMTVDYLSSPGKPFVDLAMAPIVLGKVIKGGSAVMEALSTQLAEHSGIPALNKLIQAQKLELQAKYGANPVFHPQDALDDIARAEEKLADLARRTRENPAFAAEHADKSIPMVPEKALQDARNPALRVYENKFNPRNPMDVEYHRVVVNNKGQLVWARNGEVLDTTVFAERRAIYFMDQHGNTFVTENAAGIQHHSSFQKLGNPVATGMVEMESVEGRMVGKFTEESGHYGPNQPRGRSQLVLDHLNKQGADLSQVKSSIYEVNAQRRAAAAPVSAPVAKPQLPAVQPKAPVVKPQAVKPSFASVKPSPVQQVINQVKTGLNTAVAKVQSALSRVGLTSKPASPPAAPVAKPAMAVKPAAPSFASVQPTAVQKVVNQVKSGLNVAATKVQSALAKVGLVSKPAPVAPAVAPKVSTVKPATPAKAPAKAPTTTPAKAPAVAKPAAKSAPKKK